MNKVYSQDKVESKWYKFWEENEYFKPEINPSGKPYSILLPPPNVTGNLHMGHALMLTIEDILIRYHRMLGDKTLWLPGTDHAAIATQSKVESILYENQNKTRHDLGREKFLKLVEEFAQASHDTIVSQMKAIGASLDWDREAYTLDEERNLAVRTAFKILYDKGLIYQGNTIVNWDPNLATTISDDEVTWKEQKTPLYYLKYGPFTIATARPETKFGDKYVVMHPDDKRYGEYKDGQKIEVEWINGKITATIVKDDVVDMEFGTGVMTITPWHDKTDFEIAKRHNLNIEQIIDLEGKLLSIAGEFKGMHIQKARAQIVDKLKEKGLLVKVDEKYMHRLATNYRGGGILEPQVMKQWMIDVEKEFEQKGKKVTLKKLMKEGVESGQIKIIPQRFVKIYYHWIDNLRDWCISRQIWYGHKIPVWYCNACQAAQTAGSTKAISSVHVSIETLERCPTCGSSDIVQDPDTLDTWFSSGLWPFSTLGWPKQTEDLKTYHPTSVMETGYDILFFWVARMILMTKALLEDIPFKEVFLHGLVRDPQRQKMSKSKGNIIDPLDLINKFGTDALRIALVFGTASGSDIAMSEDKIRGMRNFTNKLWNIGRFIIEFNPNKEIASSKTPRNDTSTALSAGVIASAAKQSQNEYDQKIINKLEETSDTVTKALETYRFHEAAETLYEFIWHEFADKYIESTKNRRTEAQPVLEYVFRTSLELLHPFMPFITEELWQRLPHTGKSIILAKWPRKL